MSKSYHKYYNRVPGIAGNTEHYRQMARLIRRMHREMLRNLVPVCTQEELDEVLYHIPKRAYYDLWLAPQDFHSFVSKRKQACELESCEDVPSETRCLRSLLIERSRLKGYPLHRRREYSYKECEDAF